MINSDIENVLITMKKNGMITPDDRIKISIPDAKTVLTDYLEYTLKIQNTQMVWLPEYEDIANWLSNNNGLGLFMYGNCGRGKSIIGRYVIPAILFKFCRKVVSVFDVQEMNKNIDDVLSKHIISLDDIGTEDISVNYGNKRLAFAEIMDAAEKYGKLLIISTNLQGSDIRKMYGDRIYDRIKSTTKRVIFQGDSLRG